MAFVAFVAPLFDDSIPTRVDPASAGARPSLKRAVLIVREHARESQRSGHQEACRQSEQAASFRAVCGSWFRRLASRFATMTPSAIVMLFQASGTGASSMVESIPVKTAKGIGPPPYSEVTGTRIYLRPCVVTDAVAWLNLRPVVQSWMEA